MDTIFLLPFGIILSLVILINPFIGLMLITALLPLSLLQGVGGSFLGIFTAATPIKIAGGITFLPVLMRYGINSWGNFLKPITVKLVCLFVAWIVLSGFIHPGFATRENFTNFISFLILGYIIYFLVSNIRRFRLIIWVILISLSAGCLKGLTSRFGSDFRIQGTGYGPNEFAITLLPFIAISFYNAFAEKKKILKIVSIIITIILTTALVFTFSRGGFIGFLGMILIGAARSKGKIKAIVLLIFLSIILSSLMPSYVWERFTQTKEVIQNLDETSNVETTKRRYLLAQAAWKMFKDYPVIGVGIGNYYYRCRDYESVYPGRAHTMYLEVAAELGIIGISLLFGILISTLIMLNRLRKNIFPEVSAYANGLFSGFVGFIIAAIFLHAEQEKTLWFVIFMAVALSNIARIQQKNPKGCKNEKITQ